MCSLFGFLDYQGIILHKVLRKLTQVLANAAEERGTDAAGISYINEGKVVIYKRPKLLTSFISIRPRARELSWDIPV